MDFQEVVARRRMVRRYVPDRPVPPEVVERIVDTALRGPSAGFSQGFGFLVLDDPEGVARFREAATPEDEPENWFAATFDAPLVIVACSNKDAYLDRYAQPDKGFVDRSDAWWPAPYWDIDTGFGVLLMLLTAVDDGLGACFFGIAKTRLGAVREAFGIPGHFLPIGAVTVGYSDEPPRDLRARRKPRQESSIAAAGRELGWDAGRDGPRSGGRAGRMTSTGGHPSELVGAHVAGQADRLVDLRRDLHAHPELSFEEHRTTRLVREQLAGSGIELRTCPTETGAVGVLQGGRPGATVMLRADIDGLPVEEGTGRPFASSAPGAMHACGHDAHTAILLGVAAALAARAEDLPGRYLFAFQPAEERVSGAQAMVDGGLLETEAPAAAIGLHVATLAPTGTVLARPGLAMAGAWGLGITITSAGGHGALQPRQGNVVLAASAIAHRLHEAVTGMGADGTGAVCSPGQISAGTAPNVVPTRAELWATLRWFDAGQREESMRRLRSIVAEVEADFDVSASLEVAFGTGPVRNDPAVTATVLGAARRALPDAVVGDMGAPVAASDDVSVLLDAVPGCYMMVGAAIDDGVTRLHHSPTFDIDERALLIGATALAASAVALAADGHTPAASNARKAT